MNLNQFLELAHDPAWWHRYSRIIFYGATLQSVFLNRLFTSLEKRNSLPAPLHRYSAELYGEASVIGALSQALLGNNLCYWLGDLSSLKKTTKKRQDLVSFVAAYKGPHKALFFVDNKISHEEGAVTINCDETITPVLLSLLALTLGYEPTADKLNLILAIVRENEIVSLDSICLLFDYTDLINRKQLPLYQDYIGELIDRRYSLSTLTDCFFRQDAVGLFAMWRKMSGDYSDIFWIVFWAEQVWRAYLVVYFMQQKNYRDAKRMSFRLPYSFVNTLWKQHDMKKLAQAYQYLYTCDYKLKRGEIAEPIESFFIVYFSSLR
jgi:hypothetical protein